MRIAFRLPDATLGVTGAEYMVRMALSHVPETAKFEIHVDDNEIIGQPQREEDGSCILAHVPGELLLGDSANTSTEHTLKLIGHEMDSPLLVNALELLVQVPA